FAIACRGHVVDVDRLSVDIAEIAQGLEERVETRRPRLEGTGLESEKADPRDCFGVLRLARCRDEKQGERCKRHAMLRPSREPGARYGCVTVACPDSAPSDRGHQNLPTESNLQSNVRPRHCQALL